MIKNNRPLVFIVCLFILAAPYLLPGKKTVLLDAIAWFSAIAFAGAFLGRTLPQHANIYLLAAVIAWLVMGAGATETAIVLLWLISSWSIGLLIMRAMYRKKEPSQYSATEALILGASIWLAVWGLQIHFSIHQRWLYLLLCLLPCLHLTQQSSVIRADWSRRTDRAAQWIRSIPLWYWIAGLSIMGWALRWTSLPSMAYDDHALHLRIWTELQTKQSVDFDVQGQIWSVAPFAVDLLHAALSVMAGHDARSAMNLAMAIAILVLMGRILSTMKLPVWVQCMLMALMASTPMLGNLLLSLQTELVLAVLTLAGMHLVMNAKGGWRGQNALGVLACAALCVGIKLPGAVLGITLLAALAIQWWSQRATSIQAQGQHRLHWPALLVLIPLGFVALHSYALAWSITRNPVFPLYNAIFQSPFYAQENFSDSRWIHGFSFFNYFRAFFQTSDFFESGNYTAGWQYLFLLPPAILATFRPGTPQSLRIALIPILGFGLAMFAATQYWRYLFPVMPMAGVLMAAMFLDRKPAHSALIAVATLICMALNLAFFSRISWMMNSSPSKVFTHEGQKDAIRLYAPAFLLTGTINQLAPGARVLYPSNTPYGATLHGTPLYVNWYAPSRATRFASLKNESDMGQFLAKEKVDFAITNMNEAKTFGTPETVLREYLANYGTVVAQEGSYLLYRINETPPIYRSIFDLTASSRHTADESMTSSSVPTGEFQATEKPLQLVTIQTRRATQARYRVDYTCPSEKGYFIAQINWDKGPVYYRLIECKAQKSSFIETVPIPLGASSGAIYATTRDTPQARIEHLTLEIH